MGRLGLSCAATQRVGSKFGSTNPSKGTIYKLLLGDLKSISITAQVELSFLWGLLQLV